MNYKHGGMTEARWLDVSFFEFVGSDEETENKVIDSLTNLEVTVIMISHSDTFLKYFNKVIDLKDFK